MAVNKNSSRASRPGANRGPALSGEVSLVQSLNGGKHARVTDPATNKSHHVAVSGEEFNAAVSRVVDAGLGERVRADLESLHARFPEHGWDQALRRLDGAGVFAGAQE